ncbi:MAG: hypothetical protein COC06_04585 [Bacteroidales bacterium]|nr:MAG: hypothetical protein COC06_04585 [Bacteroidales bacterium]
MKTILVSAYAINPYKGSEDGTGWNLVLQIARFQKVIAITRENNRSHIERYLLAEPNVLYKNISFLYFDTPKWMRFWKRGERGAMLYYLLWQYFLPAFIKKKEIDFDLVHNLNFHNDWSPSWLWKLKKPMVWGPVGHHPIIPKEYISNGRIEKVKDHLKWMVKNYFWKYDPFLKKTLHNTSKVLAMHSQVEKVLGLEKEKIVYLSQVGATDVNYVEKTEPDEFVVLSVGRFVTLKGFDIAIKAFAKFYHSLNQEQKKKVKFKIIGKGPEENKLIGLALKFKVKDSVEFVKWMSKSDLKKEYENASVFLFPSHEGAGMVVAEALSYGIPLLCFDNCGPGELAGFSGMKVPYSSPEKSINGFAKHLQTLYTDPFLLQIMSKVARERFESQFRWDRKGDILKEVYAQL